MLCLMTASRKKIEEVAVYDANAMPLRKPLVHKGARECTRAEGGKAKVRRIGDVQSRGA
jgi:hypothetical protein